MKEQKLFYSGYKSEEVNKIDIEKVNILYKRYIVEYNVDKKGRRVLWH